MSNRKRVPFLDAILMLYRYARVRIYEQLKSVAFIITYLVVFQTLILGVPLANALGTAGGIALVIFGLAFFLEGLILGLMPVGERVGVKLPTKVGIAVISIFGIVLGFGATLAEPAISALKTAGSTVTAWNNPLLYMMLNTYTDALVYSVGAGVGIAVAMGMFRFYYNMSIKPFIFIIIPFLLILSLIASFDANLTQIIGLAWDSGAVTTGAVTVPLVLALGIGVCRAASKGKSTSGGFGIILLASAFPIMAVLALGIILNFSAPKPTSEQEFFSKGYREKALKIFSSEEELNKHAFTHGSHVARESYYGSSDEYSKAIRSLAEKPENSKNIIGDLSVASWILQKSSDKERHLLSDVNLNEKQAVAFDVVTTLKEESIAGVRAVIPLSVFLVIVLILFLREKLRYKDEVTLGIIFTLVGMTLLTAGIRLGLASLGGEVGSQLPRAFAKEDKFVDRVIINNFDSTLLFKSIGSDGQQKTFFNLADNDEIKRIEFNPELYNNQEKKYEHIVTQSPLFGKDLSTIGLVLVLIFAFGLGYGATLAEPALNALGMTVEGLTVGTVKRTKIVQVVSIGVGLGITLGMARILFDLPLIWLIIPPYLLLMPLTYFSEEEFSAIAWDSGGVTTGPVTVPLVLAMGLSVGGAINIVDGFGVLALASAFPIITVLIYGLWARSRQRRAVLKNDVKEETNE